MASLWEVVTSNSTLPVQSGTTFWDHLNNQSGDGGGGPSTIVANNFENFAVELADEGIDVVLQDDSIRIILDEDEM